MLNDCIRLSSTTIDSLKNRSRGDLQRSVIGNSDGQHALLVLAYLGWADFCGLVLFRTAHDEAHDAFMTLPA